MLKTLKKEIESREICFQMSHMSTGKRNSEKISHPERKDFVDEYQSTGSTLSNTGNYYGDKSNKSISCMYCTRNHKSSRCDVITDVPARKAILRKKARCFLCLKGRHVVRNCNSTAKCYKCNGRHHISICEQPMKKDENSKSDGTGDNSRNGQYSGVTTTQRSTTLLQTAQASVISDNGRSQKISLLFDSCSQKSYINDNIRQQLNLPLLRKERMIIKAFESINEGSRVIDVVRAKIQGINKSLTVDVELYVVPRICSPISSQTIELAQATYDHVIDLALADTTNGSPNYD